MGEDSSIERHLRGGQDRLVRINAAVEAFRRLAPTDYGYFLATIEADLRVTTAVELSAGLPSPLLLAAPAEARAPVVPTSMEAPVVGSLRETVLDVLSDGCPRSTAEIRKAVEARKPVKYATLKTEIFTLRKKGLLHAEGPNRGRIYTSTVAQTHRAAKKREPSTKPPRRKRDDDEDRGARLPSPVLDAESLYASAISGHHLLTAAEEQALASHLEEVEVDLWTQILEGPLAPRARHLLLAHDPPLEPKSASEARTLDLDRLIANRVIVRDPDVPETPILARTRARLRALAVEADRIRERFITCNLRLVPSTIRRYGYHLTSGMAMSDLIQEGNFGLLKSVSRFDHRRGFRFSTFACWWIRHYLVRARQNLVAEVRVPVHLQDLATKVRNAKIKLSRDLGRDPTLDELARALKVSKKTLQSLDGDWPRFREALPAFDSVSGADGDLPSYLASDAISADVVLVQHEDDTRLHGAVERLPQLLAQVVRRRYGLDGSPPETLREIGDSMKLCRERVRQLEKKALRLLRLGGNIQDVQEGQGAGDVEDAA